MINSTCPLVLHNLYEYDIQSAYPTILNKQFYDFKDIYLENKVYRSIFIGKQQKNNEGLSQFLINSADNLVRFYLQENNISDDEIITSQRDGFIIKKLLDNNDEFINMKFRGFIDLLVISIDRTKYLYFKGDEVIVKGMPYYYDKINIFYDMIKSLNFYNKKVLFQQLNHIKDLVYTTEDITPFLIPGDNSFIVITYKGNLQIKDPDYIDIKTIDRDKYFNHYLQGFIRSIFIESY